MIRKLYKNSEFGQKVITLMTGASLSQLVLFLVVPILTRLYTVSDMGEFALILSFSSIFSVIATGRYEQAIILIDEKKEFHQSIVPAYILAIKQSAGLRKRSVQARRENC